MILATFLLLQKTTWTGAGLVRYGEEKKRVQKGNFQLAF
jgi:hypothetical protein